MVNSCWTHHQPAFGAMSPRRHSTPRPGSQVRLLECGLPVNVGTDFLNMGFLSTKNISHVRDVEEIDGEENWGIGRDPVSVDRWGRWNSDALRKKEGELRWERRIANVWAAGRPLDHLSANGIPISWLTTLVTRYLRSRFSAQPICRRHQ